MAKGCPLIQRASISVSYTHLAVISEVMIDTNIIIFGLVWIGITLLILLFFINVEYKYMCKKKSTHKWKTITYKELKEKMDYNLQHDVLHAGIYDATDCPRINIS